MKRFSIFLSLATIVLCTCNPAKQQKPIALHPENSHYFIYKDKPEVLITSGEHYGAVLNLDFDYVKYLETLSKDSLNLTRVFTGVYLEPIGAFKIEGNTLAPDPTKFICPWARSESPGYVRGGNKFDLTKWNEDYFTRLKDFMGEAEKRKIIVELALFCPFYEDSLWHMSPMNSINNVNGVGPKDRTHVYTLDKSNGLVEVHDALVRKIVKELEGYGNLIYEICNEPYWGGVTMDWQHHIASLIQSEEKNFTHQHLISQNIANDKLLIKDPYPAVSVFNFHYAYPPVAVAQNFHHNKVIGDNETGFDGNADSTYRREGWSFILAGGALYNNLDYSFTADHEDGSFQYPSTQPGGGTPELRRQLSYLKSFIESFDFLNMKPDSTLISGDSIVVSNAQVLAEAGKQYAVYVFGKGPHTFDLTAPAGNYTVEFLNPLTGIFESRQDVVSDGRIKLTSPEYTEDLAIKVMRSDPPM
jgi:hypothetical protein